MPDSFFDTAEALCREFKEKLCALKRNYRLFFSILRGRPEKGCERVGTALEMVALAEQYCCLSRVARVIELAALLDPLLNPHGGCELDLRGATQLLLLCNKVRSRYLFHDAFVLYVANLIDSGKISPAVRKLQHKLPGWLECIASEECRWITESRAIIDYDIMKAIGTSTEIAVLISDIIRHVGGSMGSVKFYSVISRLYLEPEHVLVPIQKKIHDTLLVDNLKILRKATSDYGFICAEFTNKGCHEYYPFHWDDVE